jgi:hypothetical protein
MVIRYCILHSYQHKKSEKIICITWDNFLWMMLIIHVKEFFLPEVPLASIFRTDRGPILCSSCYQKAMYRKFSLDIK